MRLMEKDVNRSNDIDKICSYSIYKPILFCLITFIPVYLMVYILFENYIFPIESILIDANKGEVVFFFVNLIEKTSLYLLLYLIMINLFCFFMIKKLREAIQCLKEIKSEECKGIQGN